MHKYLATFHSACSSFSANNFQLTIMLHSLRGQRQRERERQEGRGKGWGSAAPTIYWLFFGLILTSGKLNCNCFRQSMGPPVYLTGNCRTIYPGFPLLPSPPLLPLPFLAVLMMQPQTAACTCCHSQRSQQSGSRKHFKALFGVRNIFAIASSIGARFTYVFAVIANTASRCVVSPPVPPG